MGPETSDDAGVYLISPECALVETADIITPLVDDPYTFGQIAAANAISDVYAMGGRPLTAMNLAFFPACSMEGEILQQILAGGQSVLKEAGISLVGGHTVEDDELKYGLSVTGLVHPGQIIRNSSARPGDELILTKPIGSGIISTALKGELASPEAVLEASGWMTRLNRESAQLMTQCHASAATDVTGFGLFGHACEMARGAGLTFKLEFSSIPLMSGITGFIREGMVPAGCYRNRDYYLPFVNNWGLLSEEALLPLFDPQTSGGLLIALSPEDAETYLSESSRQGLYARRIGSVLPPQPQPLEIA